MNAEHVRGLANRALDLVERFAEVAERWVLVVEKRSAKSKLPAEPKKHWTKG